MNNSTKTTWTQRIQERGIRIFYHTRQNMGAVDFRTHIQNASQILVALPAPPALQSQFHTIGKILTLFDASKLTVLLQGDPPLGLPGKPLILNDYPANRFQVRPPEFWDQFMNPDFFLDLDLRFDLLYPMLCRRLHIPIRAAFSKFAVETYYNIILQPSGDYDHHLKAMQHFLTNMVAP